MKDTGAERRNYARQRTHLPAEIQSGLVLVHGTVEHLAFGSLFVQASRTLLPNTLLKIKLDLPGQVSPFCGSGRVVWVQKNQGMGIQFIDLPVAKCLKLEQFLVS